MAWEKVQMMPGEGIDRFAARLNELANAMEDETGAAVPDVLRVSKARNTITQEYDDVMDVTWGRVTNWPELKQCMVDAGLNARLRRERPGRSGDGGSGRERPREHRERRDRDKVAAAGSYSRGSLERDIHCYRCGKEGHASTRCKAPIDQMLKGLCSKCGRPEHGECDKNFTCRRCGKPGHAGATCMAPVSEMVFTPTNFNQEGSDGKRQTNGTTYVKKMKGGKGKGKGGRQDGKVMRIKEWETPANEVLAHPLVREAIQRARV